jgi:hypothetical protein
MKAVPYSSIYHFVKFDKIWSTRRLDFVIYKVSSV